MELNYIIDGLIDGIKEQSDNIKPKFIDLVKYDIKHIKD